MNQKEKTGTKTNFLPWLLIVFVLVVVLGVSYWYYIKYVEPTGTMTLYPSSSTTVQISPSTSANLMVYTNTEFGFQLTLPDNWIGYTTSEKNEMDVVQRYIYFWVSTTDQAFSSDNKGYASPMLLTIYTPAGWDGVQAQEGPKPSLFGQTNNYIIGYSTWQDCPSDLCSKITSSDFKEIVKSFKAL